MVVFLQIFLLLHSFLFHHHHHHNLVTPYRSIGKLEPSAQPSLRPSILTLSQYTIIQRIEDTSLAPLPSLTVSPPSPALKTLPRKRSIPIISFMGFGSKGTGTPVAEDGLYIQCRRQSPRQRQSSLPNQNSHIATKAFDINRPSSIHALAHSYAADAPQNQNDSTAQTTYTPSPCPQHNTTARRATHTPCPQHVLPAPQTPNTAYPSDTKFEIEHDDGPHVTVAGTQRLARLTQPQSEAFRRGYSDFGGLPTGPPAWAAGWQDEVQC
ncbi:hypothetical protein BD324DRAFT_426684 [Kockovaella imperatae]|uniref:Uncharacterized protein n=1 Tax=Kockovaella imperatae TaxID=4999 RepID=A0A1Y1UI04_9TREE|nr:hypothetical protein BD324DRAFT_426684 [Kockovaella imperatae]ORX37116.1 hypothetical protein BD324DRAFT_426684 [Kockovaella imperatae]